MLLTHTSACVFRLHGMLSAIHAELHEVPLYMSIHAMCKVLHCQCPPIASVRSAIVAQGYSVSQVPSTLYIVCSSEMSPWYLP